MAEQGAAALPWGAFESRYAHVERVIHGKRGSGWRVVKHKTAGGSLIIATDVFKTRSQAEAHLREEYDGVDARSKAEGPPLRKGWPGEEEARKTEKAAGIHFVTGLMQAEMTFRPPPVSQQIGWSPGRSKYLCVETVVDSKGVSTFFVNYPHTSLCPSASADSAEQPAAEEALYESSFADRARAEEAVEAYCKKKKIEVSQLVRTGYPGRDAARAQEESAQIQARTGQWQAVSVRSKHPLVIHDLATTGTKVAGTAPHAAKPSMKRAHSEMSSAGPAVSSAEGATASAVEGGTAGGEGTGTTNGTGGAGEPSSTPSGPPTKTPRTEKGEKAPSATGGNYHMSADGLSYWWFPRPRGRPSNELLARERDYIRQIEAGEVDAASVGAVKKALKKGPGLLSTSALFSALTGSGADHGDYRLEGAGDHIQLDASATAASASGASSAAAGAEGSSAALGQGAASTPALALMRAQAGTGVPSFSSSSAVALPNASAAPSAAAAGAASGLGPQIARVATAFKIQPGKLKFSAGEPIDAHALLHAHIPQEEALVALSQDPACSALFAAGSFEGQKIGEELVVIRRAEALRSEFSKRSDTASATQMQQVVGSRTAALQKYMLSRVGAGGVAGAGGVGALNPQAALMAHLLLQRQHQQQQHQQQLVLAASLANANLASALAAVGGPSSFASLPGMQGALLRPVASASQVADNSASSLMGTGSMSQATAASLLGALPPGLASTGLSSAGLSTGLVMPSELAAADADAPQPTETAGQKPPA